MYKRGTIHQEEQTPESQKNRKAKASHICLTDTVNIKITSGLGGNESRNKNTLTTKILGYSVS